MAEKSSSSSSSGIGNALEGEPIITWTCAVLKECLRSQGGRLTGKKVYLVWRQTVHLVTKSWSVISTERLPRLVFTELSPVTKPRGCKESSVHVSGRSGQTTRQRSRTTALARVHRLHRLSYPLMVHILPICILSRQLIYMRNFFRGSVPISNTSKKKLSVTGIRLESGARERQEDAGTSKDVSRPKIELGSQPPAP